MFVVIHKRRNFIHPSLWEVINVFGTFDLVGACEYVDKLEAQVSDDDYAYWSKNNNLIVQELTAPS